MIQRIKERRWISLDWAVLTLGCLMLASALFGTFLTPATAEVPVTAALTWDSDQPI